MAREGVAGLYHGFLPTLLRDVPELALQFTLYEKLRHLVQRHRQVPSRSCHSALQNSAWEQLVCDGLQEMRYAISPLVGSCTSAA